MSSAIETRGLSKSFGHVRAVDSVSLHVEQGEIYGFLGLNGAGKTTTIRALLGMIRPSTGSVRLLGQAVGPNGRGPWRRVGHLVEAPAAYPELTVWENLEIARRLQGIPNRNITSRVIERLGLTTYADRKAGVLSMGNFQRLGLARALLHEPLHRPISRHRHSRTSEACPGHSVPGTAYQGGVQGQRGCPPEAVDNGLRLSLIRPMI
jgi:ABC-2 type transport system ATP-binding protein